MASAAIPTAPATRVAGASRSRVAIVPDAATTRQEHRAGGRSAAPRSLAELRRVHPRAAEMVTEAKALRAHARRVADLGRLAETFAYRYAVASDTEAFDRLGIGVTVHIQDAGTEDVCVRFELLTKATGGDAIVFASLSCYHTMSEDGTLYLDVLDPGGEDFTVRQRQPLTVTELVLYQDAVARLVEGARLLGMVSGHADPVAPPREAYH